MNTGILSKSTSNAYWYHGILIFTRAYSQPESEDIESLHSCQLLEECEQNLKSLQNYKESLDRVISKYPDIRQYLKQNLLPFPADWPGWYYPKKLIANNRSDKYTSLIPEQGQFHVPLNAVEDTVIIFKHFFDKLFFAFIWFSITKEAPSLSILTPCYCSSTWLANGMRQSLEKIIFLQES